MKPKIAIVADWLINRGGAERVILALHELFPDAPIHTPLYSKENLPDFEDCAVVSSFLQKIPFAVKKHYSLLPLLPYVFEQFDLSKFDIVISSCHSASKGIITKPRTLHICYCHSPMRYAWDNSHEYIEQYGIPKIFLNRARRILHNLRMWDREAADRVDYFAANSQHVRRRIWKYYRRDSSVIYPPVETSKFQLSKKCGKYFLAVGRFTPYKRFDLLINVFNELRLPLLIVGRGRDEAKLKKLAKHTIQFLGEISDEDLVQVYAEAKALVFPQVEDLGITPLEAMACGKPVIAYSEGGALETIVPGETGLFFNEQREEPLKRILLEFENLKWDPSKIRRHAEKFDKKVFHDRIKRFVDGKWDVWQKEMG